MEWKGGNTKGFVTSSSALLPRGASEDDESEESEDSRKGYDPMKKEKPRGKFGSLPISDPRRFNKPIPKARQVPASARTHRGASVRRYTSRSILAVQVWLCKCISMVQLYVLQHLRTSSPEAAPCFFRSRWGKATLEYLHGSGGTRTKSSSRTIVGTWKAMPAKRVLPSSPSGPPPRTRKQI